MKDELTHEQTSAVLKALDEAIAKGPWDDSNFLRVIGKNLQDIRENFAKHITINEELLSRNVDLSSNKPILEAGRQEIFISLYSSEGNNLQYWERIINNLPRYIISRPIYANEEHIQELIKSKENKVNEAYVSIVVNKDDILNVGQEKISSDKFGRSLLTMKDRAIELNNIIRFIHVSGIYSYLKGKLVKN